MTNYRTYSFLFEIGTPFLVSWKILTEGYKCDVKVVFMSRNGFWQIKERPFAPTTGLVLVTRCSVTFPVCRLHTDGLFAVKHLNTVVIATGFYSR